MVRRIGGTTHLLKRDLADTHARVERDRHAVEVADFERDGSGESRIDEAGGAVNDDAEPTETGAALDSRDEIVGDSQDFLRHSEHELSGLDHVGIAVADGDHPHVSLERFRASRVDDREFAVFVELEGIA